MIMKRILFAALLAVFTLGVSAQRFQEQLDRGLVAVKTTTGVFCSWRILADEYFGVAYNLYRDGTKVNAEPLTVSNYRDAAGTASSHYTVRAVVGGVEQASSAQATVLANAWLEIPRPKRYSVGNGDDITDKFMPNDATIADVDGDGQMEILVKQWCTVNNAGYGGPDYDRIEVFKLDGTLLWWIDCGANLWDFQHNETNIAAYDWDEDGKAECIMRAADGTTIHAADGKTYVIGDASKKYRYSGEQFVHEGGEYLIYLDGQTGTPYNIGPSSHPTYMEYPLKRLESGETDLNAAWGDGYGHRSSKHFFGAPYFDGRNPSIFMARGIYTRHKMAAFDVDKATHKLVRRWTWNCNSPGSIWYGQGYHNYAIADVDCDGRDEIVFGSMVIDDNGRGLSSTGLGHGDAEHVGDYNPYVPGLEIYACNETRPANNYRDATTSKIYYRLAGGSDDGRSMMGNFTNRYPGAIGASGHDTPVSAVTNAHIDGLTKKPGLDFRIYWDGDLNDECLDAGDATVFTISNYDSGTSWQLEGSLSNNSTKGTPCMSCDIFGDWREEVIARTSNGNMRIYTTTIPTNYRVATLLSDKQYRNAMVWQMNGYNQPPAVSYFIGQLEGITAAPPAETTLGRTEVANGATIASDLDGKQVLLAETGDMTVAVADGAAPEVLFDNAPSWVQGHDNNNNITYTYYNHTLTGGAFAGGMRLVKQGEGALTLPAVEQRYTGPTDVWAGTLNFDGTLNSRLWLNRLTALNSDGGNFKKGIEADYGAQINPGGAGKAGSVSTDSLILNFGAQVNIDLYSDGFAADTIKANVLRVQKKNWSNGPAYSTPVLHFVTHPAEGETSIADGKYLIGQVGTLVGSLDNLVIDGLANSKNALSLEDGRLYITIRNYKAGTVTWTGADGSTWNLDHALNFKDANGEAVPFVPGDTVRFDDSFTTATAQVTGVIAPAALVFDNTKTITIDGDSIVGEPDVIKNGTGEVIFKNVNRLGKTTINAGKVTVSALANNIGQDYGSLGSVSKAVTLTNGATLKVSAAATCNQPVYIVDEGTVETAASLTMSRGFLGGGVLTKKGGSSLNLSTGNSLSKLIIDGGTVNSAGDLPKNLEMHNATLSDPTGYNTNQSDIHVPANMSASITGGPYTIYTGKLTGSGTLRFTNTGIRSALRGDWSDFEGTIVLGQGKRGSYAATAVEFDNDYGMPLATLNVPSGVTASSSYSKGSSHDVSVGSFAGSGTLGGNGRWILGANDKDITFGLSTVESTSLVKRGTGNLRVLALGKINSKLDVQNGYLLFNEATLKTKLLANNQLTVSNSGKVVSQGLIQSVQLTDNAQLTPSSSVFKPENPTTPGTIATSTIFRANANAQVNFLISRGGTSPRNSKLQVGSFLYLSRVNVVLTDDYTPAVGDKFTLWTCTRVMTAPTAITLPDLPEGMYWDTTALTDGSTEGVLAIVATPTGISGVAAEGAVVPMTVYTVSGAKVMQLKASASNLAATLAAHGLAQGTYVVKSSQGVKKVVVK